MITLHLIQGSDNDKKVLINIGINTFTIKTEKKYKFDGGKEALSPLLQLR